MAYKCLKCGHIFEYGEEATWNESRGEYWGGDCSEISSGCPLCCGDYEETKICSVCGSEFLENEMCNGVCDECIDEHSNDAKMCFEIGKADKESVAINCFLASKFDADEIEKILWRELLKNSDNIDCSDFINADRSWFAERLAEEVKKDENSKN